MSRDIEIFQCNCCGNIQKVNEKYRPRGDTMYVKLWCDKCNQYTRQLYCGDDENDLYLMYNENIDPRMY